MGLCERVDSCDVPAVGPSHEWICPPTCRMPPNHNETVRKPARFERNLGLILLALLLLGCLLVMRPFMSALLWAVVLSFSTWPVYRRVLGVLGGRPTPAAMLMTLAIVLVLLVPFLVIGFTLADSVKDLTVATRKWFEGGPPAPPTWLGNIPWLGDQAVVAWKSVAGDSGRLLKGLNRLVEPVSAGLVNFGAMVGAGLFQLALSILVSFFLFRDGELFARTVQSGVARIAGDRGIHLLQLAGNTVRGVVYGILGTALVQAILAGVGFMVAGVPGAALLALLTFFLSVVPMGPPLVWGPATFWLFHQGSTGWAIFMLIWGLLVSSIDNVVKPWLISQGSDLPFLLILFGVIGGVLVFGVIGMFLGPTLLGLGYRLIREWVTVAAPAMAASAGAEDPSGGATADPD